MKWWPFGNKTIEEKKEVPVEDDHKEELDEELELAEQKLRRDRERTKELARAVASARRVHYRVDQFTEEIERSFGRVNHG